VIVTRGVEGGLYTMPPRSGARFKVGDHRFSRQGDPDGDRVPTADDVERVRTLFAENFRKPERYALLEARACYYTVTLDEAFIVEAIGARGFAVSACSGHGFKLAPLIADQLAQTVLGDIDLAQASAYCAARSGALA
jgi:glycine/D-amino acid oxidase-like deaminating enzyme